LPPNNHHTKELIGLYIRNNDRVAFREFYDIYYPKLINFARVFLQDFSQVQEVVSDVFYKILKNPSLLERADDVDSYLFVAVKNRALSSQKRIKIFGNYRSIEDVKDYLIPEKGNPEDIFIESELYGIIWHVIKKMPPKRRTIYMMIKEDGMRYKEVAKLLDVSVKTIEAHMFEAMKPIRKAVRHYLEGKDAEIRTIKRKFYFF
jgi:RNA polymerase sigma-70 factor (ECF subfamily)